MVNVSPTTSNPSHEMSIKGYGFEYGLRLEGGAAGVREIPQEPFTMDISGGGTRYGTGDPTFTSVESSSWIDGMGHEFRDLRRSGFYDSRNAWTLSQDFILPTMQHRYSTGAWKETYEYLENARNVSWQKLTSGYRYLADTFTVGASAYDANKIYLRIRRVGKPGTLTYAIYTDSAGVPNALVTSASGTVTTSTITDFVSEWYGIDVSAAGNLTAATAYWIVVYGASTDNDTNHWEVGIDSSGSTTKKSTAGSSWSAAGSSLFFRVAPADIRRKWHFFVLEKALYAIDERDDGGNSTCLINGDRGIADGDYATTTLSDSAKSWTADEWIGAWVYIHKGTGKGEYSQITDNDTTKLTFGAIAITPDATSEYIIYSADKWTAVTTSGVTTVKDVAVMNNIAYIAQGSGDALVRMQWNSATPTHDFADDTGNLADVLYVDADAEGGPQMWRGENDVVDVSRSDAKAWGTALAFGTEIDVGDDNYEITDIVGYDGAIYVMKENHPYKIVSDRAEPFLKNLAHIPSVNQGKGAIEHDVFFYIPWADFALEQFYGSSLDDVGYKEFPSGRVGNYASLVSHPGGIICAIDAGSGTSSVMVRENARGGWHELFRAFAAGERIRSLHWQDCPGTRPRLWYSIGGDIMYQEFPIRFVPIRDSSVSYHCEAVLESSTIDLQKASWFKYFHDLTLRSRNLGSGIKVILEYKLDKDIEDSAIEWRQVGEFLSSPKAELSIRQGEVSKIRYRLRLLTNDHDKPAVVEAANLEGFARRQLKFNYQLRIRLKSQQTDKNGSPDHDPSDVLAFLKTAARRARVLTMRSVFEELHNIPVIVEPPTILRKYSNNILQWWGGSITITLREA